MSYKCAIIADSVSPTGKRLTTMEITFPRIVLAEFNTHRMFSRNSASSRAIPVRKMLDKVLTDPFIPQRFPMAGKGMQPGDYFLPGMSGYQEALGTWLDGRNRAVFYVERMAEIGVHKQIANRMLEPWLWHTVIVTATEWANFFKLRCHPDAQEQIRIIADMMYDVYTSAGETIKQYGETERLREIHNPHNVKFLREDEWHCPYVNEEDKPPISDYIAKEIMKFDRGLPSTVNPNTGGPFIKVATEIEKKISVARCARVSYLTHDGQRDVEKDLELFTRLSTSGHWSPFEHVATPYFREGEIVDIDQSTFNGKEDLWAGNFLGWKQYRKFFGDENITEYAKA